MKISVFRLLGLMTILHLFVFTNVAFSQSFYTTIEKNKANQWAVEYESDHSLFRIAFKRNPDDSRVKRWKPVDSEFEVFVENHKEFVRRKDGAPFKEVKLQLTPKYKHLPKEYAPFSPFSDGGMLIHSGRFFACENICDDIQNKWHLRLKVPQGEHIILNGEKLLSKASWVDSDSGKSIYVGKQEPENSNSFLTMIDAGLPVFIKESLEADIPKMLSFFELRLGKLPAGIRPTIFASYSKVKGTSVQGGVLPNQIFIHWDKDDLEKHSDDKKFINDLLWLFAHETGHFYQQFSSKNIEHSESWIHEGHAELLAYDALTELYPTSEDYRKEKVIKLKDDCVNRLGNTSLVNAAKKSNFKAYYSCGFFIHQMIEKNYLNGSDPYAIWQLFRSMPNEESKSAQERFLETVANNIDQNLASSIKRFINTEHDKPKEAVEALISNSGF